VAASRVNTKIRIDQLSKVFSAGKRTVAALEGVSLGIGDGEFVTLVGASGCGKSTLLRIIGGLETASGGSVSVAGREVQGPGPDRAMVFQQYSLYPWLTVMENIKFSRGLRAGRENLSSSDVEVAAGRAEALISIMGLGHVVGQFPSQLSGGMQQRVAIARALMTRPQVLLMDEPFGALDAQTREVMHDLIRHVFRLEQTTIVFVTHDVEEAIYLGERVVIMAPSPGRIDSICEVPLPAERDQDMKEAPEFLQMRRRVLTRIRETCNVKTDLHLLAKLTRQASIS
jgi:NitT/TauT family transport system ATP-binding protein